MRNQIKQAPQSTHSNEIAWVVGSSSVELLRANPDKIFVFGDNLLRRGTAGQAIVRHEPNTFGVPTKRAPSMRASSFFSDQPDERQAVLVALRNLFVLARSKTVVFPSAGLGTGLAQMAIKSPNVYREMCEVLSEYFGFDQPRMGSNG